MGTDHLCLLCDPEDGDGTDPETCAATQEYWPLDEDGCAFSTRCLCPHPYHLRWECYTIEDVEDIEDAEFDEEGG